MAPPSNRSTADVLYYALISTDDVESKMIVNVVDGLYAVARSIDNLADAVRQNKEAAVNRET